MTFRPLALDGPDLMVPILKQLSYVCCAGMRTTFRRVEFLREDIPFSIIGAMLWLCLSLLFWWDETTERFQFLFTHLDAFRCAPEGIRTLTVF